MENSCLNCGKNIGQNNGDANKIEQQNEQIEESDIIETLSNAAKSANYEHFGNDGSVTFPVNLNQEYVDSDRELKDICTKIVVEQFFGSSNNLYNFMKLTIDSYTENIRQFIKQSNLPDDSILFLYKVNIYF